MKYFILLLSSILFFACNQSVKKDFSTDSLTRGNGIICDDIKFEVNGEFTKRTEFVYGEKVNVVFNNVIGLKKINGKMFPEISICVLNSKKDTIINNSELLQLTNGTDLFPLQLSAHFNAVMPTQEKYTVRVNIWDKKGNGTFLYEMPFTVKENNLLTIKKQGIDYSELYLWNETQKLAVVQNKINAKDEFYLILEGLDGFTKLNNTAFPALSIKITDRKGNYIINNPNVLEQHSTTGVPEVDLRTGQIPVSITFTPGLMNNPCKLEAVLTDLKSDKKITINADLEIES